MRIRCAVACKNASGEPDFFFTTVDCTAEAAEDGDHYDAAVAAAKAAGYAGPMLAYDENDGPEWLFGQHPAKLLPPPVTHYTWKVYDTDDDEAPTLQTPHGDTDGYDDPYDLTFAGPEEAIADLEGIDGVFASQDIRARWYLCKVTTEPVPLPRPLTLREDHGVIDPPRFDTFRVATKPTGDPLYFNAPHDCDPKLVIASYAKLRGLTLHASVVHVDKTLYVAAVLSDEGHPLWESPAMQAHGTPPPRKRGKRSS